VKRFKVDNRRTRILTPDEQRRIIEVAPRKLRTLIAMALITGARAGELLGLKWEHVSGADLTFLHTKNGKARRIPCPTRAVLAAAAPARLRLDE
jgi:integrase